MAFALTVGHCYLCLDSLSVLECTRKTMADQFSICSLCYLVWKKAAASLCSVFRSSAVLISCKIPHLMEIRLLKEKCIFLEYLCNFFYLRCNFTSQGWFFFFFCSGSSTDVSWLTNAIYTFFNIVLVWNFGLCIALRCNSLILCPRKMNAIFIDKYLLIIF